MELIINNPYRIVGILSNATTKELEKQKGKIKAYTRVGKEIKSDFDFEIFNSISRTDETINNAFSKIEQNQDKVNYSLFWFLNANSFDKTAIEYLKNGDAEKAIEIWEKITNDKDVNSKNFSAFNNLGTYKLLSSNPTEIKEGIEAKIKLIESDYFENFVHSVADETYVIDKQKEAEKLIDELLVQLKKQYSNSETLQLFSGCNGTTQKYLSKKLTEEPLLKIENQIENCKKNRKANKENAYKYGTKLFINTKDDLSILKSLLGTNDLKYKTIADQLANEIMQCGIDYFNEKQKNDSDEDYIEQAQKLNKQALEIAVGSLARDRAKEHIATLEKIKDRDLNQAIGLLQSIKDAYEKAIDEIDELVSMAKSRMSYGQSINYSKIEVMKKTCLDWPKVIDMVHKTIPKSKVVNIKKSSNTSKLEKYKSLVDFLLDVSIFNFSIKYLAYWKTETQTQTKTTPPSEKNKETDNKTETSNVGLYLLAAVLFAVVLVMFNIDIHGKIKSVI